MGLQFELVATIPSRCVLGEGPVWDERIGVLWFTDIQQQQLLCWLWDCGRLERFDLPERLGSLGLTGSPHRLICAFASGFAFFEPANGLCTWLHRSEPEYRGVRMNDGKVDRQGRFWAGSMVEDEKRPPLERGTLYRLDHGDGSEAAKLLSGISISNSTCFSPVGDRLYFTDTPTQQIDIFDCDVQSGAIGNRRKFASLSGEAFPDGSDVDAEGRLWNAEWGSGRVTVYNPDGTVEAQLALSVSQATCVAFGGPDLDRLFVTTAREGLSPEQLNEEPNAGDVFIIQTNSRGLPAPIFAG